jgi:GNAT superfamily N-acetyltransferase
VQTLTAGPIDPWRIEILVVARMARSSAERSAISRDVERGLLLRLRPGAYVDRVGFGALSPEEQHVVRIRAVVATSGGPVLVSHWSAAVLHGRPVLRSRLGSVHVTVPEDDDRHREGVVTHHFLVDDAEVVRHGQLIVTSIGRTVVDIAGGSPFEEGVMVADAALRSGVPREVLEEAVELAGARRASRRIAEVVAFGHPGAESAAESRYRVSSMRAGFEVPVLQRRIVLADGSEVFLDGWYPSVNTGVEVDGDEKYLDPKMAPEGAGRAVLKEKRREDEVRLDLRALVRIGWVQSGSATAVQTVLARVGVRPSRPRTPIQAYIEAARHARPRRRAS